MLFKVTFAASRLSYMKKLTLLLLFLTSINTIAQVKSYEAKLLKIGEPKNGDYTFGPIVDCEYTIIVADKYIALSHDNGVETFSISKIESRNISEKTGAEKVTLSCLNKDGIKVTVIICQKKYLSEYNEFWFLIGNKLLIYLVE